MNIALSPLNMSPCNHWNKKKQDKDEPLETLIKSAVEAINTIDESDYS
jgi:hypothetical protein